MRLSLRYRLLVPLLVLLIGDAAGTAWATREAARHADQRLADQLRAVARTLAVPPTFPLTPRVLDQMKGLSGAEFLLIRSDSTVIATFAAPIPDPPTGGITSADLSQPVPDLGPTVVMADTEYRCLKLPLRPPHPSEGGTLYIFYPEALRRTAMWDAARPPLLLGGVGGVVALMLAAAVSAGLVRRVRALDRQARAIADGDFRPAPLPETNDELRDLATSVNEMAHRLAAFRDALAMAERMRVLGQFAGGLAHQLRNAAAGAKLAVQLHRDENPTADPESLTVALRQLGRIEATLTQFLNLGRPSMVAPKPCDLRDAIGTAVELLRPQCRHTGTELTWIPPDAPAVILGDPVQLGHLFGNLLGNAIEAAGPGGTVEVTLIRDDQEFLVEVTDTGAGPPSEFAERLFDPFVTTKEHGIGLGLAVAKQAAETHGGTIGWERRSGMTVFRVTLPVRL